MVGPVSTAPWPLSRPGAATGAREYGMPGPAAPGIRVAWIQGAAVAPGCAAALDG